MRFILSPQFIITKIKIRQQESRAFQTFQQKQSPHINYAGGLFLL